MLKKIIICICLGSSLLIHTYAQAPVVSSEKELVEAEVVFAKVAAPIPLSIPELVEKYANQYNVSAQQMLATISCESSNNKNAVGDFGTSYGLAQIHLPAWPHITRAQATDPEFAVKFMAQQFARGNQRAWTCWRIIYS